MTSAAGSSKLKVILINGWVSDIAFMARAQLFRRASGFLLTTILDNSVALKDNDMMYGTQLVEPSVEQSLDANSEHLLCCLVLLSNAFNHIVKLYKDINNSIEC